MPYEIKKLPRNQIGRKVLTCKPYNSSFRLDRLRGCEIDYSDDLTDAGFKINNPKAARSCGCGTSFEPLDDDADLLAVSGGEACETN